MSQRRERGLAELYVEDPDRADFEVFGRRTDGSRRGFLRNAGWLGLTAAVGGAMPFGRLFPGGLIPAALAEGLTSLPIEGKDGLLVLNDRPLNAETPPHLLSDLVTPTTRHFIRNNGVPPASMDASSWRLRIRGRVEKEMTFSIADLKREFDVHELALQLECGGNGRASFNPPASGNQWTLGAIGNSKWKGVRLADVLERAGVAPDAIHTGHLGADTHLSGEPGKQSLSRGMPIAKAMDPANLIAFEQNGAPLHPHNGAPLRLVVPGWPGSCSQKWLTEIRLVDHVWDGAKMAAPSYSVPRYRARPGEVVAKDQFRTIQSMPVKSIITTPANGQRHPSATQPLTVSGQAWAGDSAVQAMEVSIDFGASWHKATLDAPINRYAWQAWRAAIRFPVRGYYEVWARATDTTGAQQPFAIDWNPKGYLNNAMHRIAVLVES